jgi:hypothetical protein
MRPRALTWIVLAIAAGAAARRWLDVVEVRGRSMAPTLLPGDRLVVARLHRTPRVGEVVLAPDPGRPRRELVKRVAIVEPGAVALRGDNVAASTDARVAPDRVRSSRSTRAARQPAPFPMRSWPGQGSRPSRRRPRPAASRKPTRSTVARRSNPGTSPPRGAESPGVHALAQAARIALTQPSTSAATSSTSAPASAATRCSTPAVGRTASRAAGAW